VFDVFVVIVVCCCWQASSDMLMILQYAQCKWLRHTPHFHKSHVWSCI